jgi:hypothetical protein
MVAEAARRDHWSRAVRCALLLVALCCAAHTCGAVFADQTGGEWCVPSAPINPFPPRARSALQLTSRLALSSSPSPRLTVTVTVTVNVCAWARYQQYVGEATHVLFHPSAAARTVFVGSDQAIAALNARTGTLTA